MPSGAEMTRQRRNSEGRMTRSKAAAASAAAKVKGGSIRLRSGSAGHKQLDDEDEDEEHQAIQVGKPFCIQGVPSARGRGWC